MKKIKIITAAISLCMAASLLAGCNEQAGESAQVSRIDGGQTKISVENGGGNTSATGAYKFSYKGYEIGLGDTLGKASEALGEPVEVRDGASCAFEGFDVEYYYAGFVILAKKDGADTEDSIAIIDTIIIEDPLIDCGGIHVGQTLEDAKKVYGDPFQEDDFGVTYRSGNTELQFSSDEFHTITQIMYKTVFE